jgi:hypothetical protein
MARDAEKNAAARQRVLAVVPLADMLVASHVSAYGQKADIGLSSIAIKLLRAGYARARPWEPMMGAAVKVTTPRHFGVYPHATHGVEYGKSLRP